VGGELRVKGKNSEHQLWNIGIDKPVPNLKTRALVAVISLNNKALATSGNYRKIHEKDGIKYSHTINPKTGYPIQRNILSASVICDNCALADGYATTFMVEGLEGSKKILNEHKELAAFLIYSDENGKIKYYISNSIKKYLQLNPNN